MAEKLSITLPKNMVDLIKEHVTSGSYASVSEVLREAMRAWIKREEEYEKHMASLCAKVQASLEDPRPSLSSDEARARLDALYLEKA